MNAFSDVGDSDAAPTNHGAGETFNRGVNGAVDPSRDDLGEYNLQDEHGRSNAIVS